jgi:hypothetical protein
VSANKTGIANNFLVLINLLYDIEREIKESTDEIRFETRQKKSKPMCELYEYNRKHLLQFFNHLIGRKHEKQSLCDESKKISHNIATQYEYVVPA